MRQTAQIIERTIKEIRSHDTITDDLIAEICAKNSINEAHIRRVAGFKPNPKPQEKFFKELTIRCDADSWPDVRAMLIAAGYTLHDGHEWHEHHNCAFTYDNGVIDTGDEADLYGGEVVGMNQIKSEE